MTHKAKQAQSPTRPTTQVVLFGLDESGKPKAARFSEAQATLATKAAAQLKLQVLTVNDSKTSELAALLPSGRVHANGKGFIPAIRRDLYSKLLEASGQPPEPQSAPTIGNTDQAAAGKLTNKRPKTWQEIAAGHIVIIQDDDPKDGWWEAIVVAATADMLSLRWRANPRQRQIARHRMSVGLMYPDQAGSAEAQQSSAPTNGSASPKKSGEAAATLTPESEYPRSWTAVGPDHPVLAREDGPLGQWWEAVVVSQQGETFTLRWRDHVDLPTIVRPRQELALLHPINKVGSSDKLR
jgi:hypothetical protein